MEEEEEEEKGLPVASSPGTSSRWNPTKEQISLLEGLYRQGVRTPTADEIQHITGKLQQYGRIEGKNVFYWFQNHKARQRQKQKQENLGYFTRFLRTRAGPPVLCPAPPHPTLPPATPACTATNVVCSPFCLPQYAGIGFYPPFQKVVLPGAANLRPEGVAQKMETPMQRSPEESNPYRLHCAHGKDAISAHGDAASYKTLQLFPLHPTGILEGKSGGSLESVSSDCESLDEEEGGDKPLPFDFFGS